MIDKIKKNLAQKCLILKSRCLMLKSDTIPQRKTIVRLYFQPISIWQVNEPKINRSSKLKLLKSICPC